MSCAGRRLGMGAVVVAAFAAVVAACSSTPEPTIVPVVVCDPAQIRPAPRLTCEAAISAAIPIALREARAPISRVIFEYGAWCPPNARCVVTAWDTGRVIFEFADGSEPLAVQAWIDGDAVVAGVAASVPDWWTPDGVDAVNLHS